MKEWSKDSWYLTESARSKHQIDSIIYCDLEPFFILADDRAEENASAESCDKIRDVLAKANCGPFGGILEDVCKGRSGFFAKVSGNETERLGELDADSVLDHGFADRGAGTFKAGVVREEFLQDASAV